MGLFFRYTLPVQWLSVWADAAVYHKDMPGNDQFIPHGKLNSFSTRPHQNVVWYKNKTKSWLGFLKILNYVPKEREIFSAKNEPSFVRVKCCDDS